MSMHVYRMTVEELARAVHEAKAFATHLMPTKPVLANLLLDVGEIAKMELFVRKYGGTREEAEREFRAITAQTHD